MNMGYIYLYLSILFSVVIANMLKMYEKHGYSSSKLLFLGNYIIASLFSFAVSGFSLQITKTDLSVTFAAGFLFLGGFLLFISNISKNGLSVSTSTFRVSYVIPVVLSILFFREHANIFNYAGILLIVASFIILGYKNGRIKIVPLILLFLFAGGADFCPKLFMYLSKSPMGTFLTFTYAFAFIFNLAAIILWREKFSLRKFLLGFTIGIPNMLTTFFFMKALAYMKAPVAYALLASNVVLFTLITDRLIWRSSVSRRTLVSILIVISGILLLYIKV